MFDRPFCYGGVGALMISSARCMTGA